MKKSLILPIILMSLSLVACNDDKNPSDSIPQGGGGVTHDHLYDGYQIDGDEHYQKCTYLNCDYETEHTKHVYDQEIASVEAFKQVASCSSPALFYKSCVCGVISTTETFEHGSALEHNGAGDFHSDATHHWKVCDCGESHSKVEHDLLNKEDQVSCTVDGGKYQECKECGWVTPVEDREDYVAALGHDFEDNFTLASFPNNYSNGKLSIACKRESCNTLTYVDLPYATQENYTFNVVGDNLELSLTNSALTNILANSNVAGLEEMLNGYKLVTPKDKVGYPYTFTINGNQVLPTVPSDVDYDQNHLSVVIGINAGDVLSVYKDGSVVNFTETEWGPLFSGTSYTATSSAVLKLHLSKDGGIYSQVVNTLPFESYTIKVDGVENTEAKVEDPGNDFAKFELELEEGQVVTFYGDGNALSGGIVTDATKGYTVVTSGTHTFYINNYNEIYVTAPDLEDPIVINYYYYNSLEWDSVNCYSWCDEGTQISGAWPGTAMEPVEGKDGWFKYSIELVQVANQLNVIFNNGSAQTADILVSTDLMNLAEGYYYFGTNTTAYTSFEEVEDAVNNYVPPVTEDITVYFLNSQNWSTVNAYVWNGEGNKASWPGENMSKVGTYEGYDVYAYTFSNSYVNIIFNNGSSQTVDIALSTLGEHNAFKLTTNTGKLNVAPWTYTAE